MIIKNHTISMHSANYIHESFSSEIFEEFKTPQVNENHTNSLSSDEIIKELSTIILRNLLILSKRHDIELDFTKFVQADFQTKAYIQALDKNIEVDINLHLSSSFTQHFSTSKLKFFDPLVLNLDANAPKLSHHSFSFDIDMDGEVDQVSMLMKNSGFLALDKNSNSIIDNESELFGTKSGNGFMDLKGYDIDNNNWIDENDPIFKKLRVWQKTPHSNELLALGEVGIGAIYLGNAHTDFPLYKENQLLGQMKSSGFFLKEDGQSGIISQIDLVKQPSLRDVLQKDAKTTNDLLDKKIKQLEAQTLLQAT